VSREQHHAHLEAPSLSLPFVPRLHHPHGPSRGHTSQLRATLERQRGDGLQGLRDQPLPALRSRRRFFRRCLHRLALLVFYGLPWGNRGVYEVFFQMAQSKATLEIQERVFNDAFDASFSTWIKCRLPETRWRVSSSTTKEKREIRHHLRQGRIYRQQSQHPGSDAEAVKGDIHRSEPAHNLFQKIRFESYDMRLELAAP